MKKNKYGKVYLKEKDLVKKLQSMDINGTGSSEDPFIVDQPFQPPESTIIKESSLYIKFIGQEFQGLGLRRSQNIMFENGSLEVLDIHQSSRIQVSNCTIKTLFFTGGYNNDFNNCEIGDIPLNILSYNNRFINCTISDDAKAILLKEGGSFSLDFIPQILHLMVLVLGISFLSSIITSIFEIWDWISVIVFGGSLIGVSALYLYLRKVLTAPQEKPKNQIINDGKLENS
jgi:hypothetical protein